MNKSNSARETIKLFWHHVRRYPLLALGIAVVTPITILLHQFLPPLIVSDILDRLTKGDYIPQDFFGSFGPTLILYLVVYMFGNVVGWRFLIFLLWKLEMQVMRDLAQRCFAQLMRLDANFHVNHFAGSMVSQTNKLLGAYVRFADTTLFNVAGLVLSFVFTVVILLPRAPLFVLVLFLLAIVYIAIALVTAKRIRHFNTIEAQAQTRQTGFLADSITNIMAVKSFARTSYENTRFAEATESTRQSTHNLMRATLRRDTYFSLVSTAFNIASLVLAIVIVMFFNADIGTVFLVLTYGLNVVQKLWDFSTNALRNYNRSFGDAHDMVNILKRQPAVQDAENPLKPAIKAGGVTVNHVTFTHADDSDALFDNLNLQIKPGEKIGLVGHSGSGKTTFTRLLLRYVDIDKGEILIDGQNIARLAQEALRAHIAYVPQEPLLFHRTIKENIAYGKPDATDEELMTAARKANAAEFIEKLPQGYDTLVGERGVKLSGGQRQRIAIARAILKDAPILVLDEATSALDSESEKLIQEALWELMKGRTAIVIAHRLSTVQRMDRIVVMDSGAVIEQGTHNQLLKQQGAYAKLWTHQSGGFIED